jgi:hypothetical protein
MVKLKNGVVIDAAPIIKRFVGQRFSNLISWAESFNPEVETATLARSDSDVDPDPRKK